MSAALLVLAILFNTSMTRSMAMHMLVHIPLILFAGICASAAWCSSRWAKPGFWKRRVRNWKKYNEQGLPGLLLCSLVAAYWMIPKSLDDVLRSEEHTSELQSLMRISYAVFCLQNKKTIHLSQCII